MKLFNIDICTEILSNDVMTNDDENIPIENVDDDTIRRPMAWHDSWNYSVKR